MVTSTIFSYFIHKKIFQRHIKIIYFHIGNEFSFANNPKTITDSLDIRENMCIEKYGFFCFFEF